MTDNPSHLGNYVTADNTLAVAVVEDSLPAALDRLCAAVAGLMAESDVHQFLYRFLTADTPPSCVGVHVG